MSGKLSSRVVEVTILLSDIRSSNHKLIKIKPMELIREDANHLQEEVTSNVENTTIQTELQTAHETLQNLKEQQSRLIKETEAEIATERATGGTEKQTTVEEDKEEENEAEYANDKQESRNEEELLLEKTNEIIKAAKTDYHKTLEQSEGIILDIAIHTAEKILKQKLSQKPESFLPIVTEAIKEIKDQSDITIYLHPANYTFVLEQKDELAHVLDDEKDVSIYIDENVAEGNCLIAHAFGQVDASIDTQLQQVRKCLHELKMENKRWI